jgi:hypothetical protein
VFKSRFKNLWIAYLPINSELKFLGEWKTEKAAALRVNSKCKEHGMELKNPQLSDDNAVKNDFSDYDPSSNDDADQVPVTSALFLLQT